MRFLSASAARSWAPIIWTAALFANRIVPCTSIIRMDSGECSASDKNFSSLSRSVISVVFFSVISRKTPVQTSSSLWAAGFPLPQNQMVSPEGFTNRPSKNQGTTFFWLSSIDSREPVPVVRVHMQGKPPEKILIRIIEP